MASTTGADPTLPKLTKLSVVIPARDEEGCIASTVEHLHLELRLQEAQDARHRLIATDGVFSMDGYVAPLGSIVELAERYDALVMVDDSHAVGFVGPTGAGTPELFEVQDRVDIVTGTLGKALGGASGGMPSRFFAYFTTNRFAGSASVMTW